MKTELVLAARKEELDWIRKREVYEKVPLDTCYRETGRGLITLKWVDVNKGDDTHERDRSRLVVRAIKKKGQRVLLDHMLFSSMPPLEALKALCSLMVTLKVGRHSRKSYSLKLFDISRPHFYG